MTRGSDLADTPLAHAVPIGHVTDSSATEARATATVFRALGHPLRLHLIQLLAAGGTVSLSQLVVSTGANRSLVCQHLRTLAADGLVVVVHRHGPATTYRVREGLVSRLGLLVRA